MTVSFIELPLHLISAFLTDELDASQFLAQSHSRIGLNPEETPRNSEKERRQGYGSQRFRSTRSYLQRPSLGNPYQSSASQLSNFPFASRSHAPSAPLFYSAADFREENDEEEHEREVADHYALQRSRRHFGGNRVEESSEAEDSKSSLEESGDGRNKDDRGHRRGGGIKSSWRGDRSFRMARSDSKPTRDDGSMGRLFIGDSLQTGKGKEKMVNVGLGSVTQNGLGGQDKDDSLGDFAVELLPDDDPPSIQQFRKPPTTLFEQAPPFLPQETGAESVLQKPPPPDSEDGSTPLTEFDSVQPPRHDAFWGYLYLISLAALFSSFFLVFLHTSAPSLKHPLGDTIYTTMHASYHLLAIDTLVAVIVSLLWLAILRSYVRYLVYAILVGVPIILFSFSLFPFISSFKGQWDGLSIQDKAMRWFSFIPGILTGVWIYNIYRGRHSLSKAIDILEFSCRILAANPGLIASGFTALIGVITWTWIWMAMFTRVFLGGHLSTTKNFFILDAGTWWLGLFFFFVYLWTLGVGAGIQRATTAATISQWYFHRFAVPAPTPKQVILAALSHSTGTLFGTICLHTLILLIIRLPFLILPRRLISLLGICTYTLMPSPISTLTNPLTLTYAAIHSQSLAASSKALTSLSFLSPENPSSLPYRQNRTSNLLLPYNLSLLLLRATRFITSLALGFGAWVNTARLAFVSNGATNSPSLRGSLYAYVVGLIAAAIGWGILGAVDGVLTGVVDAVVVCWGSEVGRGNGEVRYCREAAQLFGGDEEDDAEGGRGFLRRV